MRGALQLRAAAPRKAAGRVPNRPVIDCFARGSAAGPGLRETGEKRRVRRGRERRAWRKRPGQRTPQPAAPGGRAAALRVAPARSPSGAPHRAGRSTQQSRSGCGSECAPPRNAQPAHAHGRRHGRAAAAPPALRAARGDGGRRGRAAQNAAAQAERARGAHALRSHARVTERGADADEQPASTSATRVCVRCLRGSTSKPLAPFAQKQGVCRASATRPPGPRRGAQDADVAAV
jgi:hypothetical protein